MPGTGLGNQTLLTINQPVTASSMADALKYILEWAAVVCTATPHLSIQFVQSLADAIEYTGSGQQLFVLQSFSYLYSLYCL